MARYYHSEMVGAPQNVNSLGAMCGILDDCLVNGFNAKSPLTVTVSGGVATLLYATAHGYSNDIDLRVADAAVGAVNGEKRCTVLDAQTLTLPVPGAPDGPVGGTVITRVAPLGWEVAFSDANVRVYRSPSVESSRMYFRLEDSSTASYSPAMRGYEAMTGASVGTDLFPTDAQQGGAGFLFYKSNSSTPRPWVLVGDGRTVYLAVTDSTAEAVYPFCFGDFDSGRPGDAFNALLTPVNGSAVDKLAMSGAPGHFLARSHDQVTKSVSATSISPLGNNSGSNGSYPSAVNGGATFRWPVAISEAGQMRGYFRGLMHVWEPIASWPFGLYSGIEGVSGRVLTMMCGTGGRVAFPLDEAW